MTEEESNNREPEQCLPNNTDTHTNIILDNVVSEHASTDKEVTLSEASSFTPGTNVKADGMGTIDGVSVVSLETFIVGRRFHDEVELWQGAEISVLRDPENVNDANVLLTDSGSSHMLGFLPRELAEHLSPLIDKFYIKIEGSVTSLPNSSSGVVPIRISCHQLMQEGEMDDNNRQLLCSSWGNCLHVVEDINRFPPYKEKYQHNFIIMIHEVLKHEAHLFDDDEKRFLELFDSLPDDSQRLLIRLYTRKGPWFRMANVSYPEISDSNNAIEELHDAGYVCLFQSKGPSKCEVDEVMNALTVLELRQIPMLPSMLLERSGICVRVSCTADLLLWRVQRLFFLNGEQDLSSFLLVDLGLVKYPNYTCNTSLPIFRNRNDLLAYEEALDVAEMMDQSLDANDLDTVMRCIEISDDSMSSSCKNISQTPFPDAATFLSCFTASWVYSKVVTLGVSFFECEQRYGDAVRLLKGLLKRITCDGRRGYWTLRLSIDLEHMGYINESLLVAEEGLLDPWVRAGSKLALQKRVLRLGKPPRRWKTPSFAKSINRSIKEVHVMGRPLNCETGMKIRFYGYDGEQCGVEQLALQHYAEEGGWKGVHAESGIWLTIFGLVMWDVIFADIPNVFRTKFQTAPLDLNTDRFYMERESLIEAHLQKICEGMAEEILIKSWQSHEGMACRGVNWERHSLTDLRAAVLCIGGSCLVSLCRHLAQDYRSWSSGMPDLLIWRFRGGETDGGEAKLVEVKSARDRLSEQQRAWLLLLMDCGFAVEVCKVSPMPPSI
ncbi:hypothetical protein QJS04_geneDACA015224 [Acorus gramineus]|uniref:Fanconi-associated nuclease n=2 Tax=Acorus gramineus TaxID=55184 RepID=A0AAV9BA22_ACOGR|nr:hypothetical protein QJS04_geneDACA015224 [Acorus gramineus]